MKGEDLPGRGETIGKDLEIGNSLVCAGIAWGAGERQVIYR